jgi:membrane-associated phospholipid phosphatase
MPLALIGLAIAFGVMLLFGGMELDRALLLLAYAGQRDDLATYARWVTELGGWRVLTPVTLLAAGLLLFRREWRDALLLVAITVSGRFLIDLLKDWTGRIRPQDQVHLVEVQSLSFPSGHAANATLVWLGLAILLPRTARARGPAIWAAVWLAILVGASRVVLGVHWPSDVIGGWAFGLFWALLLLRLSGYSLVEGTPSAPAHFPHIPKERENGGQNPS